MKEILLSNGGVCLVDDCDYEYLNSFKWYRKKGNKTFYAERYLGKVDGKYRHIYMHKEIMEKNGGLRIDHKDENGLNNQRLNLRFATHGQNLANRKVRKNSSSKYKGVSWNEQCKKWDVRLRKNGTQYWLGLFKTEEEAALAYDIKAKDLHKEFAFSNFK